MPRKNRYQPRKDGRFYTLVGTGKYLDDGRPERIPLYADSSKELEVAVDNLKSLINTGKYKKPSEITIEDYANRWFRTFKSKKRMNTKAMYENVINKHIVPSIGYLKVKALTRTDCQLMVNERFDRYETCNKIRLTMRQLQKAAKQDKLIIEDFWVDIEMPKPPKTQKRALTVLEKEAITLAELTTMEQVLVYLLYAVGMRREEVLALHATDFTLKEKTVTIRHVITFDGNAPILEETAKTGDSLRTLHIPATFFPVIQFYVKSCEKSKQELLFTTGQGKMITKSSYIKLWNGIVDKLNYAVLPKKRKDEIEKVIAADGKKSWRKEMEKEDRQIVGLTAHIFRHNYATMLYYSNISELNAVKLMGHADGKMIREIYAHLDEEKENTAERLDIAIAL